MEIQDQFEQYIFAKYIHSLTLNLGNSTSLFRNLINWLYEDGFVSLGIYLPEYNKDKEKFNKQNTTLVKFASNRASRGLVNLYQLK